MSPHHHWCYFRIAWPDYARDLGLLFAAVGDVTAAAAVDVVIDAAAAAAPEVAPDAVGEHRFQGSSGQTDRRE